VPFFGRASAMGSARWAPFFTGSHIPEWDPQFVCWGPLKRMRAPARGSTAKTVAPNPAAIAEYFKDAGKRPNARVSFGEQHIRRYGDVGVITGYYTFSDVRDGQTVLRPARFTMVFRNRDGKWLLVAHHSSVVP
jgi:hypothetical protein